MRNGLFYFTRPSFILLWSANLKINTAFFEAIKYTRCWPILTSAVGKDIDWDRQSRPGKQVSKQASLIGFSAERQAVHLISFVDLFQLQPFSHFHRSFQFLQARHCTVITHWIVTIQRREVIGFAFLRYPLAPWKHQSTAASRSYILQTTYTTKRFRMYGVTALLRKASKFGGHDFPITTNLESALRHLRLPYEPRILWIDAICI